MPLIRLEEMEDWRISGSWRMLERIATEIITDAESRTGTRMNPLLGGGTRLMLRLNHRVSHDIDLFIRDPQWIGFISPRLNEGFNHVLKGFEEDATFVKLKMEWGEIDFIVRMSLLNLPSEQSEDVSFLMEPMAEVLAKKLFYRGHSLTPRDLFDWVCLEKFAPEALYVDKISKVIAGKEDGIFEAIGNMGKDPIAKKRWEEINTPLSLGFEEALSWGKDRIFKYQKMKG